MAWAFTHMYTHIYVSTHVTLLDGEAFPHPKSVVDVVTVVNTVENAQWAVSKLRRYSLAARR